MDKYTARKEDESTLGSLISASAIKFFERVENRRAFEAWYLERYGKPYQWKLSKGR